MELEVGCLGQCEAYQVAVYADGFVDYRGWAYVKHGRRTGHLAPAELAELDAVFARHRFASFDGGAFHCSETDLGELYTIAYGGKQVSFFSLCDKVPDAALDLVGDVVATLQLRRWFGTDRERARLPESRSR